MFIRWLQGHLLPCPFKYVTGIDCPGCGFQRSVLALVQGDLPKSFALYPAAIPLLLFFAYGIADRIFKLDTKNEMIKKTVYMVIGSMVLISYCIKMYRILTHHMVSA
ncbi:DUF2752 domain-containing protein [Mucilaginibacter ginsenosidivorans]|uniref:DUF2752 domain-containing protein n=1 Tax=Mucilaginibacter ginsenosidivorans TaxID=398053 RepID=A0A5B8UPR5_9SPHI|nr:DUF2752 domain-containing protein [Mucilaginibacter ginsenosidivorans]QEC61070.1 DUF2752 domain-containing protein [Mucilaginibacter ginsenosidivorans]